MTHCLQWLSAVGRRGANVGTPANPPSGGGPRARARPTGEEERRVEETDVTSQSTVTKLQSVTEAFELRATARDV